MAQKGSNAQSGKKPVAAPTMLKATTTKKMTPAPMAAQVTTTKKMTPARPKK
jgi:hypothetical protein